MSNTLMEVEAGAERIRYLIRRVQAEYSERPGLSVTMPQAQRLFGIDSRTCAAVLNTLIARGFLGRTAKGRYVRV
jgi:predicted transcriptional regulator of viral defense system